MDTLGIKSDDVANALRLLEYHHHAMETRRSLELKVFTGAVVFFLAVTRSIYEHISLLRAYTYAACWVAGAFVILLGLYGFFLYRIELATRHDRLRYHQLEQDLSPIIQTQLGGVASIGLRSANVESPFVGFIRSWAAVPPFMATMVIATGCWLFLAAAL